jgi:hypothetical protein
LQPGGLFGPKPAWPPFGNASSTRSNSTSK